jgi:hypothetical protein
MTAKTPVKRGAIGPGTNTYDTPKILKAALRLSIQVVAGYREGRRFGWLRMARSSRPSLWPHPFPSSAPWSSSSSSSARLSISYWHCSALASWQLSAAALWSKA